MPTLNAVMTLTPMMMASPAKSLATVSRLVRAPLLVAALATTNRLVRLTLVASGRQGMGVGAGKKFSYLNIKLVEFMKKLDLEAIRTEVHYLTESWAAERLEACIICLDHNGHASKVAIEVDSDKKEEFILTWGTPLTRQIRNTWQDLQEATEKGAEAIAAILVVKITEFTIIERAIKTTGIDFWLGQKKTLLPFQGREARLEVSGILNDKRDELGHRVKKKIEQSKQSSSTGLPVYVVVTDFGNPRSVMAKEDGEG